MGRRAVATGRAITRRQRRGSRHPWKENSSALAPEGRSRRAARGTLPLPLPGQISPSRLPRVLAQSRVGTRA
jgi:hypothetical protein